MWGPWNEVCFPNNGHYEVGGRKELIARQLIEDFLLRKGWTHDPVLFLRSLRRQRVLTPEMLGNVLKKDISLKRILFEELPYRKDDEVERDA